MHVSVACPKDYQPDPKVMEFTKDYPGMFLCTESPMEAAKDADVVFTDVWASMGQEEEKAVRERVFQGYQVNAELLSVAHAGCMVQHCLPAHRGEEITADVFEAHAATLDRVFGEPAACAKSRACNRNEVRERENGKQRIFTAGRWATL